MSTATDQLALNGGPKVRTDPWPHRALFGAEEKQAAVDLFDRAIAAGEAFGYNGEEEQAYCREFVEYLGVKGYADLVNSGTTAVYVALRSLDLEPFTEVIVPPVSDPGGVMPVALLNCIPVTADCAPGSFNVSAETIAQRITERTSAVVVAHISGEPADMDPIMELCRSKNIKVVEDCAQSHGATYKGRKVGTIGDVAAFSTMFGKHHATGGQGGVVFTTSEDLYWNVRRASDRGKPVGPDDPKQGNTIASLNFNQDELGAAIGRVQLKKLPRIVESRRRVALGIQKGLEKLKAVRIVGDPASGEHVFWFTFFQLDLDKLSCDKGRYVEALAAEGLAVAPTYLVKPMTGRWAKERRVFGTSGYPWAAPQYKGDPNQEYPTPNIDETDTYTFRMSIHESYGEREVSDIVAAFEKVEAAFLK